MKERFTSKSKSNDQYLRREENATCFNNTTYRRWWKFALLTGRPQKKNILTSRTRRSREQHIYYDTLSKSRDLIMDYHWNECNFSHPVPLPLSFPSSTPPSTIKESAFQTRHGDSAVSYAPRWQKFYLKTKYLRYAVIKNDKNGLVDVITESDWKGEERRGWGPAYEGERGIFFFVWW